ncbi:ribosomal protein L24 (plastid) [Cryptomonas paramecium]|uniref:Ribosomal protein L24 n=1 Tax=Cryptomonas paramaecium TaxID=2898 RepID=D2ISA5_9CRYP|nr:ribosomal protein L24 [Cryptomonas paramecium]ACT46797.1 ribosomal protein L24 [Cryptomonas paramecium]BDA97998.1 ribosomal protein L24 [Cryptomonas paramecium]
MQLSLKKGASVKIISGKNKGAIGEVLKVIKEKDLLFVKGLNLKKKHIRSKGAEHGTIVVIEAPIHRSNVVLYNPSCTKNP